MTIYAGLDVSDKATHICVVDGDGAVVRREKFWGHKRSGDTTKVLGAQQKFWGHKVLGTQVLGTQY